MKYWDFRKIDAIEEFTFNNILEKFYKMGIDGLVRENIQNSLDGKLQDNDEPVEVIIETGSMSAEDIPGINEVKTHIWELKGQNDYSKETIAHMQATLVNSIVKYITFEDRNTRGLSGAEKGENGGEEDTWTTYAYKKGVHIKESDSEKENIRGGSYGVGKIACNAASDLHVMFFANCDKEGKQHLGGTVQLIEHKMNDQCYRSTGYFTQLDEEGSYIPFSNTFKSPFVKKTRGLKIIIPYLRNQFADETNIIKAVCDNFFVAILQDKLVVKVNNTEINRKTLVKIVKDPDIYEQQEPGDMKTNFTPLYVDTFLNCEPVPIEIKDKNNTYKFNLHFYYNDDNEIKRGRIAIVRGIGMKIQDKKIVNYATASFNAVLLPHSNNEDSFLKLLENESHTELSFEQIKNEKMQSNAKTFIINISKTIGEIINEYIRNAHPASGKMDTSDIIYTMETQFRKSLSKDVSSVHLTKGNKNSERKLVKMKTQSRKVQRTEEEKKKRNALDKIIRKVMKRDGADETNQRLRYAMKPEAVRRVVIGDTERLKFDFTNIKEYNNEPLCDISIAAVDGTGKECMNEFDINKNYGQIVDKNNGRLCTVSNNIIRNVSITDGKVELEIKTLSSYNPSLKFSYSVEV